MEIGVCCGVLAVTAFLAVLLRQYRPEAALAISVLAGGAVAALLLGTLAQPLGTVSEWLERGGVDDATVALLLKALGICLLTQLTADVCRDAGETALATHTELAGKAALLLLILPMFVQILDLAVTFINGG